MLGDGRHQGTTLAYNPDGTTEHVYVPNPVMRHCLGLCPTAGLLRRNRRSRVVNVNLPATADYFMVHYFTGNKQYRHYAPASPIKFAVTILGGCWPQMSEHDPYEWAASEADDIDMPPETAPTAAVNCSGVWSTPLLEAAPDDNVNVTDNEKHRFRAAFQSGSSTRIVLLMESLSSVGLQQLHAWCYGMWVRIDDDGRKYCAACKKSTNSNRFIAKDKMKRGKQVHRTQWLDHCISKNHVKKLKTLSLLATSDAAWRNGRSAVMDDEY